MPIAAIPAPPPGAGRRAAAGAQWRRLLDQGVGAADGSFTVTNARNGFSKTYRAR